MKKKPKKPKSPKNKKPKSPKKPKKNQKKTQQQQSVKPIRKNRGCNKEDKFCNFVNNKCNSKSGNGPNDERCFCRPSGNCGLKSQQPMQTTKKPNKTKKPKTLPNQINKY